MSFKRREFIASLSAAGLGLLAGKTSAGENEVSEINDSGKTGIKITNLKTYILPRAILVKLETNAGISGWGESSPNNTHVIRTFIETDMKDKVIGKDPFDSEPIWDELYWYNHDLGPAGALPYAIAGIDLALWDLKGKKGNEPCRKRL